MKKIILEKKKEKKQNNSLPLEYYNKDNHQEYINKLLLNQSYEHDNKIRKEIEAKVKGYIQQDKRKNREDTYITAEETIEKLVISQLKCQYCCCQLKLLYTVKRDDEQWTLDRIDNDKAHTKDNVIISCLKCNLKRRRINKDKFEFTKKLHIVKI